MKVGLLLISIIIFVLVPGCSKEDPSFGEMKISRVYAAGQLQGEYFYNTAGLLESHVVYSFPGRKTFELTCHYDAGNRLIKRENAFDLSSGPTPLWSYGYTDFSYGADGKVSEERNYTKQNNVYVLTTKIRPNYDANGKLISRTMLMPNDVPGRLTTYAYNAAGNIILREEFRYNGSVPEIEYRSMYDIYDNKRNPHIGLASSVPPFSININNILQTSVTNYVLTPGSPVTTTTNAVYSSYNTNGLPVNVTESGTNFTYEYK